MTDSEGHKKERATFRVFRSNWPVLVRLLCSMSGKWMSRVIAKHPWWNGNNHLPSEGPHWTHFRPLRRERYMHQSMTPTPCVDPKGERESQGHPHGSHAP